MKLDRATVRPRIRSRRKLVMVAMVIQLVLLLIAWTIAFRHVRGRITEAVQQYIVSRNAEFVDELAVRLPAPTDASGELMFGTPEWDAWQEVIESAGAELPGGGFACLLDPAGKILCHPDIREDQSLRSVDLGAKLIEAAGTGGGAMQRVALESASSETLSGRIQFAADGTHYVATRKVPGTELRLLVHQPEAPLFGKANELTGVVVTSGALAAGVVVLLGGLALVGVIRSYDSSFEAVNKTLRGTLEIARQIQQSTLPALAPSVRGFDVGVWNEAADETGGDTYDVIALSRDAGAVGGMGVSSGSAATKEAPADALLCVLADATGHGVGAALAISAFRSMVRMGLRAGVDLPVLVEQVNGQLNDDLPAGRFVTAWLGFVDPAAGGVLSFAAGQGPVLVSRADGSVETYIADAAPMGIIDEIDGKAGRWIPLAPGESVVVASDGIHEAHDAGGAQFGLDRLRELISAGRGETPDALIRSVCEAVEAFTGGAPADDDRTLVVVRRAD